VARLSYCIFRVRVKLTGVEERFPIYLLADGRACWPDSLRRAVAGDVAAAVTAAGEHEIVLVVPGEEVLLAEANLPPVRQTARRRQAARYALEDRLATPVDELHFALGARRGDGITPVAAIARARMAEWLQTLRTHGAEAAAAIPDYLCLPVPGDGAWRIWLLDGRALVRCGDRAGFACERELLPDLLAAGDGDRPRLEVLAEDGDAERALLERLREHGSETDTEFVEKAADMNAHLLAGAGEHPALDLRQGEYAPVSRLENWWPPLRATAALFASWLVLTLTTQAISYWQLRQEADTLHARSEAAFREAFPRVERIRDLRVQAEEELRALRGDGAAGTLFALLQATAEAGGGGGLHIESLQYREGALYLSLSGKDIQALERLRSGFARQRASRLTVESADAGGDGVQIRARVERI
jgi:general secretion pathway protein L